MGSVKAEGLLKTPMVISTPAYVDGAGGATILRLAAFEDVAPSSSTAVDVGRRKASSQGGPAPSSFRTTCCIGVKATKGDHEGRSHPRVIQAHQGRVATCAVPDDDDHDWMTMQNTGKWNPSWCGTRKMAWFRRKRNRSFRVQ
jgi:hypothetical protein